MSQWAAEPLQRGRRGQGTAQLVRQAVHNIDRVLAAEEASWPDVVRVNFYVVVVTGLASEEFLIEMEVTAAMG
jgi:enamine deaminase RidA (YjgF/YER057c/UK114 family)